MTHIEIHNFHSSDYTANHLRVCGTENKKSLVPKSLSAHYVLGFTLFEEK